MDKIIEILNKNDNAKMLHTRFNELCKQNNIIGVEYDKAKEAFLMMLIAGNAEAMQAMANETYSELSQDIIPPSTTHTTPIDISNVSFK